MTNGFVLKKIYLELTNYCNLNCSFCFRNNKQNEAQDMPHRVLDAIFKNLPQLASLKKIVLGGIGEPFSAQHFEKAVLLCRDYHLTITSNGTLLKRKYFELLTANSEVLIISIDGLHQSFAKFRGYDLAKVIKNLEAFNEFKNTYNQQKPHLFFQMVINKHNLTEVKQVIDLSSTLKVQRLILSHLLPQRIEDQDLILYQRSPNTKLKKYFRHLLNYGRMRGVYVDLPQAELKTERTCEFINQKALFINHQGEITPCYRLGDQGLEFVLGRKKEIAPFSYGHICQQSLFEITASKTYQSFQSRILNQQYPSCIDCDLVDGCDLVKTSAADCFGNEPSCADCLWARGFTKCP